jgi:hypothetical protein
MPDPILMLEAMGAAAATAAVVLLLFGWPWRTPHAAWIAAGWAIGVGLGLAVGCSLLKIPLHWPPAEDQDRFLLLVMPAVFGVELLAAVPRVWRWLILVLRGTIAAGVAPVLLHGSAYLTDSTSTEGWSPAQRWLILGGMAAALAAVWGLLALLHHRTPGRSLPAALALTCAAAGVTVMLSGYLSGGQLVLPLAAGLAGAAAASVVLSGSFGATGWLGPGVVGLFSVLVVGRFFANLTTAHSLVLFSAPLLAWLPELPGVRQLRLSQRGFVRVVLIAAVAMAVTSRAQKPSGTTSTSPAEQSSIQDYMNFKP